MFGIAETSKVLIVAVFDDEKGSKMSKIVKKVDGTPTSIDNLKEVANLHLIKKASVHSFLSLIPLVRSLQVYQVNEPETVGDSISDLIITKMVTKDLLQ